jgi:hypothetical protein
MSTGTEALGAAYIVLSLTVKTSIRPGFNFYDQESLSLFPLPDDFWATEKEVALAK